MLICLNSEPCSAKHLFSGVLQTVVAQERADSLYGVPCRSDEQGYLIITKRPKIAELFPQETVLRAAEAGLTDSVELGGSFKVRDENIETRVDFSSVDASVRPGVSAATLVL